MNQGRTAFVQIMDFVSHNEFYRCVERYGGNRKVRRLSCWGQYLAMAFAQLTYRESLRDIEVCLSAQGKKLYHSGLRSTVRRSTLADPNENRDWRIFADFARSLITVARSLYAGSDLGVDLDAIIYALDSTTIDLCLSLFLWARFRRAKGAVKLHTMLEVDWRQKRSNNRPHRTQKQAPVSRPTTSDFLLCGRHRSAVRLPDQ
jgi:hypothetical protein